MKKSITNIRKIFTQKRYFFFLLLISFIFFVFNVLIKNLGAVKNMFSEGIFSWLLFVSRLLVGFKETVPLYTFALVIIISLLTGLLFTIMIYKVSAIRKINGQLGLFGAVGIFLGVFIPGCAACSVGVLGILGITGTTLALLPFNGTEISLISVIILLISIVLVAKNLDSCNFRPTFKHRFKNSQKVILT